MNNATEMPTRTAKARAIRESGSPPCEASLPLRWRSIMTPALASAATIPIRASTMTIFMASIVAASHPSFSGRAAP